MDITTLADLLPWGGVGLSGIVTIVIVLILTGRLVPRRVHDDRVADWKAAYEAAEKRAETRDAQHTELMEMSRTTVQILQALRDRAEAGGGR